MSVKVSVSHFVRYCFFFVYLLGCPGAQTGADRKTSCFGRCCVFATCFLCECFSIFMRMFLTPHVSIDSLRGCSETRHSMSCETLLQISSLSFSSHNSSFPSRFLFLTLCTGTHTSSLSLGLLLSLSLPLSVSHTHCLCISFFLHFLPLGMNYIPLAPPPLTASLPAVEFLDINRCIGICINIFTHTRAHTRTHTHTGILSLF